MRSQKITKSVCMNKSPRAISGYTAADRLYEDSKSRYMRQIQRDSEASARCKESSESFKILKASRMYLLRGRSMQSISNPMIADSLSEHSEDCEFSRPSSDMNREVVDIVSPVLSMEPTFINEGVSSRALSPIVPAQDELSISLSPEDIPGPVSAGPAPVAEVSPRPRRKHIPWSALFSTIAREVR